MSLERFLVTVLDALGSAGIPAMLTGSVAAAVHGATRATMDVDLVIEAAPAGIDVFVDRMEARGYYVSREAAHDALASATMFNVIDPNSGWKADLIIRKARPFSEAEFARRETRELLGMSIAVSRVEDLIIAKLEWASLGGSSRQLEDVSTLIRLAAPELDTAYVQHWVEVLGLEVLWNRVRQ